MADDREGEERDDDDVASLPSVTEETDDPQTETAAAVPSARARDRERRRKAQRDRAEQIEREAAEGKRRNVERVVIGLGGVLVGGLAMFFAARGGLVAAKGASSAADAGADADTAAVAAKSPDSLAMDAGDLGGDDMLAAAAAAGAAAGTGADYRANASGPGSKMPDGTPVPSLPDNAPRAVRFGVVLVTYAGAQGAPPSARPKKEAEDLANKLAADAKTDFHGAVAKGDPGSTDDAGRVPRGVLELAPEYVLFTLPRGGVSDPIDTPRGYWIAKRTE